MPTGSLSLSANVELKKSPFPFLLSKGNPLSLLQILATIDRLETRPGFESLAAIISTQNEDGAFPRDFQKGSPSSVKITYRVLRTLHETGIDRHSFIMDSALNWLLRQQSADGGWRENPRINLPEWMTWESTSKSVTWYTCQIGKLLQELGMQNTKAFRKIVEFFESSELKSGGWSSVVGLDELDADSTVGIGDFLAQAIERDHPAVSRAKKIFDSRMADLIEQVKREGTEDAYELTHLIFEKPQNSMYRKGDERVLTLLKTLAEAQRNDGGWFTFYSKGKSDVPITVFSLQALVSHGVIDKTVLQKMFNNALKGKSP